MKYWLISLFFLGLISLAACSGSESPRLIAALPAGGEGQTYSVPPAQFVYDAYLEIEVFDPAAAAAKASERAEAYGGYLVSSQTARWENEIQVTVVLAVPANNFEKLHTALLRLGKLKQERLYSAWQDGNWYEYSEVTVSFQPSSLRLPDFSQGWDPGRTIRQAFDVFLTIFGFLADIVIWVVIALGPFALLAWGGWRLIRRLRRATMQKP
jgi:hypothetical protein